MKRFLSLLLVGLLVLATTPAHAQIASTLATESITATGSLAGSTSLTVNIVGGSGLTFDSTAGIISGTTAGVEAPEAVEILFNSNEVGDQVVIISTDNKDAGATPQFTGDPTLSGSGLVGTTDSTAAAPLLWVVFDLLTEAQSYAFVAGDGVGEDVGAIENSNQFFVVDRSQSDFDTPAVLGFATVVGGISDQTGFIANAPVAGPDDPGTPGPDPRPISDGDAYMRLAVDYKGQTAQSYATSTLTLALVTLS